jgi:hypothetical protein
VNINLAYKGKTALELHLNTENHRKRLGSVENCRSLDNFVVASNTEKKRNISAAELTLSYHTVSHHFSFRSLDCTSKLNSLIFKDSEIAKGVSLARTKCEAIVTGILGPVTVNIIKKELENVQFLGVQTDGSNHKDVKLFPVVIRYFNPIENGLTRKLIDLTSVVDEKAETISNLIINNLKELQCEEKCKAFGGDNCNTNYGSVSHSGNCNVYSFLQKEFGSIEGSGCSAHVLNNSIQHAVDSMDINIFIYLFII